MDEWYDWNAQTAYRTGLAKAERAAEWRREVQSRLGSVREWHPCTPDEALAALREKLVPTLARAA